MSEPPDFDSIVRHVVMLNTVLQDEDHTAAMVEALRQAWNSRGAADLAAMETAHENYDWTALEDAIRALDVDDAGGG